MTETERLKIFRALGEETRLRIFETLRGGRLCACKILEKFQITQPTLSHHMKILCDSGLIAREKEWKHTYYSIACDKLRELTDFLGDTACNRPACRRIVEKKEK
ncbi:MAG: ArsR/SmtB family transcription factor [Candidatus Gallimonas sp.]